MDRAGSESSNSQSITAIIPDTIDKALNGEFNEGHEFWKLTYDSPANADFEIDSNSTISGKISAKVTVTQSSGIN